MLQMLGRLETWRKEGGGSNTSVVLRCRSITSCGVDIIAMCARALFFSCSLFLSLAFSFSLPPSVCLLSLSSLSCLSRSSRSLFSDLAVGCIWAFGGLVPEACRDGSMGDNFAYNTMW